MQRRAAAIYFVFFLVIGAGAYAYIGVVSPQAPQVSIDAPERGQNDTYQIAGQTYTVTSVGPSEDSGAVVGELEWTNESARSTATLANASNVTYEDRRWQVVIANESDVSSFTLRERVNATRELVNDPAVEDETASYRGEQWVVWADNGTLRAPLDEYLPAPEEQSISVGDTFPYEGNDAEVASVTPAEATLAWTEPSTNTAELSQGGNVTLGDQTYFVNFPDESTVQVAPVYASAAQEERSDAYANYVETLDRQDYFTERINGLWGVAIVSLTAAVILLGAAYLPVKD